ncbi:hypothetical protein BGAL_0107g00190 [Botrytis galanthina]|uniref:Uncharacterized protein n=1 Tax=Botrytis galanthina TaxID=278940 RepID=A0A4V4HV16_9HELO|nr:hypothetical protein BGAL_0107g00190 [Botrytis galanthina]
MAPINRDSENNESTIITMNANGNNQRDESSPPLQDTGVTDGRGDSVSGSSVGSVPMERTTACRGNTYHEYLSSAARTLQQCTCGFMPRRLSTGGLAVGGVSMERTQGCRGYTYHEYLSSAAVPSQQCSCGFTPRRISTGGIAMGRVPMDRTQGCRGYSYHRQYTDCPCGRGEN